MSEANTVWIQLYTPGGAKLGVTIGFADGKFTETLPDVRLIDAMIAEGGYLLTAPGVEAGEDVESILYVCRYMKFDEKKDREISHVAFYAENDNLVNRWLHKYMDTDEDIADFETATGLTLDKMPVWGGDTHPAKNAPKAVRDGAIVKLAKPIRIARETYTNKEGEPRHKFKRYVDSIGKPQTAQADSGKTIVPDFTPPATTGNADGEDNSWLPKIYSLTEFLYDHIKKHQENSINKLIRERSITSDMKPIVAATHVFMHKAYEKFRLSQDDITDQLGKSLGDYLRSGKTLQDAWKDIQPPIASAATGTEGMKRATAIHAGTFLQGEHALETIDDFDDDIPF